MSGKRAVVSGKVVTERIKLSKGEYWNLCLGLKIYIITGENVMGEKLYTEIAPPKAVRP